MTTCRGRKYKLNEQGYCRDHAGQASSSNENHGLADERAELVASTCKGLHGDGKPCDLETDLDFYGFCVKHRLQGPPRRPQCIAIVREEDRRCHQTVSVNAQGFCGRHGPGNLRTPRCQGRYLKTGKPCTKDAKHNYNFCCSEHDPSLVYIPPKVLDPVGFYLRNRVEGQVVKLYDERDIYHRDLLDLQTPYALHLDHIGEKQCFTSGLCRLELRPDDENLILAQNVLRESVVNEVDNLALTRAYTNRIKGAAVWKFLDDSRTGHRDGKTFTAYLLEASCDGKIIKRDVTSRITSAMGTALKKSQRKLHNEGETPVLKKLAINLQQLYVDMELHQRGSS